jgi:hypothetical protein
LSRKRANDGRKESTTIDASGREYIGAVEATVAETSTRRWHGMSNAAAAAAAGGQKNESGESEEQSDSIAYRHNFPLGKINSGAGHTLFSRLAQLNSFGLNPNQGDK